MGDLGQCPDCGTLLVDVEGRAYCRHCDDFKPSQADMDDLGDV